MFQNRSDVNQESIVAPTVESRVERLKQWWNLTDRHARLLDEACMAFGLNPDPQAQPAELLSVKGYGDADDFEPLAVVLVTAGGRKLRWPIDAETENQLRYYVFHAFDRVLNPRTRELEIIERPLPADLRLPDAARTGLVPPRRSAVPWHQR